MIARHPTAPLQRFRTTVVDGARSYFSRPGARLRWTALLASVAVLVSLPAVVGALPVSTPERTVPQLLAAVRSSGSVPFTGFAESRGTLNIPDLDSISTPVADLLSDRSRLRVWHAGESRFRVDRLTLGAETGTYVSGRISLTWNSDRREVVRQATTKQLPQPEPPDVLPNGLGRRLLTSLPEDGAGVELGEGRRIAGRAATELRWVPNDPQSLVGEVRMWVDPESGLPLRVELRPVGSKLLAFETSFLDLELGTPDPRQLRFNVRATERIEVQDSQPQSSTDYQPTFVLPADLAGLPLRSQPRPLIGTYGEGASLVAVGAFDAGTADSIRQQIDAGGRAVLRGQFGEGTLVEAPMLRALAFSSADRGYLLAGTVTTEVLQAMALELVSNPPDLAAAP